jgi:Zn-dependent protease with chaperone function
VKSYFATLDLPRKEVSEATVLVFDKDVQIGYPNELGKQEILSWSINQTEIFFDLARQSTKLRNSVFPEVTVWIPGREAADHLKAQQQLLNQPWNKKLKAKDWARNLLIFFGVIGLLVGLYFLIVPWLSGKMASTVSINTEMQLGEALYGALGLQEQEDRIATALVSDFFEAMKIKSDYQVRVSVIEGPVINAFALPGGRIMVYKALIKKMEHYSELSALLSHEFIHVNNRHSTRSIFRKLGSKIFLGLVFGNIGSVTSVMIDHADNVKSLTYSRALEKEADLEGLRILQDRKIDPKGFADLFRHLKSTASTSALPEFLASHPDIDKRIAYISEAASGSLVRDDAELKTIFEQLKQN